MEKLEKIRARKKKYQKRAKKLKENIKEIEDALRAAKRDELDRVRVSDRIDEHLMR